MADGLEGLTVKSSSWDNFAPLAPLDRVAGRVTSRGDTYEPKIQETTVHSLTPLPVRKLSKGEVMNPEFQDLTGTLFGRLKVIGPAAVPARAQGRTAWVVRCVCGHYEHRRTKAIRRYLENRNTGDRSARCSHCNATAKLMEQK